MPVEIKELQITVTVNQQGDHSTPAASGVASDVPGKDENRNLINQCIEQVMGIIQNKKER